MEVAVNKENLFIISGGQSGTDRAALDFALKHDIACGGWCPRGRMAEDGKIPDHYPLRETDIENPAHRTRKNVDESDGTLFLSTGTLDEGSKLCLDHAKKKLKPVYLIRADEEIKKDEFLLWMDINKINKLNIAGPRESNSPGVYEFAMEILVDLFGKDS